jgi:hypothetical protein
VIHVEFSELRYVPNRQKGGLTDRQGDKDMHMFDKIKITIQNNLFKDFTGDADERRRLLRNAFYFGLRKVLLLLAVNFMLCYLVLF